MTASLDTVQASETITAVKWVSSSVTTRTLAPGRPVSINRVTSSAVMSGP